MRAPAYIVMAIGLAVALPVRAEDTAAVLAAMPDQAAEQRYLDELCRRTQSALSARVAAIDAETACFRDLALCQQRTGLEEPAKRSAAAGRAFDVTHDEYLRAAAVYRAKRALAPTVCRASADGTAVVEAKLREKTNALNAPKALGAQRAECEKACGDLNAGDACVKNCARYE